MFDAIGGIIQGLLDFRCRDLNYTAALSQPKAAVGCLLHSHNQTKRFGICRCDSSEAVSVEESQSRFSADPCMTPPTVDCSYTPNRGIISWKNSPNAFMFQDDDCPSIVSKPCSAHPICEGCPGGQLCRF